jgi:hypothetical protein
MYSMRDVLVPHSEELAVPYMAHSRVHDPKWPFLLSHLLSVSFPSLPWSTSIEVLSLATVPQDLLRGASLRDMSTNAPLIPYLAELIERAPVST